MQSIVTVRVDATQSDGRLLLAPVGMATPHQRPTGFHVAGGSVELVAEATTGQWAALVRPRLEASADPVITVSYTVEHAVDWYPPALFEPRRNRYTDAAEALVQDVRRIAAQAGGGHAAIEAIVNDTAQKFSYGHPEERIGGMAEIPLLGCGLTEGSCVDINTYLIAALRAAGLEAGYATGYFFPEEKAGTCDDMHCWVVTRHAGVVMEWDIAHHLKMGTRTICCGLNPKPGRRIALFHSMGLDFLQIGVSRLKLLAEPVWIDADGGAEDSRIAIAISDAVPPAAIMHPPNAQSPRAVI